MRSLVFLALVLTFVALALFPVAHADSRRQRVETMSGEFQFIWETDSGLIVKANIAAHPDDAAAWYQYSRERVDQFDRRRPR